MKGAWNMATTKAKQKEMSAKGATREGSIQEARQADAKKSSKQSAKPYREGSVQEARQADAKKSGERPKTGDRGKRPQ